MKANVGVVGLGIMGSAIARNLLRTGFTVVGFDIQVSSLDRLTEQGGAVAVSVADLVGKTDLILTSLPSPSALEATVRAMDAADMKGKIVAELSTLAIIDKQRAFEALAHLGAIMLDCPLSGTGAQAATGDLAVFASGDQAAAEHCRPIFTGFARAVHYVGAFGNGSKMKFVANLLVAIHNVATAEALVLGMKSGLDPHQVVAVIKSGAGNSRIFELRAPLMAAGCYEPPTMKLDVWQKDMSIIADFVKETGVDAPLFEASVPIYGAALNQGLAAQDTAAVCSVLERRAGVTRR